MRAEQATKMPPKAEVEQGLSTTQERIYVVDATQYLPDRKEGYIHHPRERAKSYVMLPQESHSGCSGKREYQLSGIIVDLELWIYRTRHIVTN